MRASLASTVNLKRVIISVAADAQAALVASLKAHGDVVRNVHRLVGAVSAEVHSSDVRALARNSSIRGISADGVVRAHGATVFLRPPSVSSPPTLVSTVRRSVGLTPAAPTGGSVRVAILDSGIAPLANLNGRIDRFYDFTKGGAAAAPYDDFGHGTFVASLIASSGADSNGLYQGVVPKARLVGFAHLTGRGRGHTEAVVAAIEFILAERQNPRSTLPRIDVINLSLGHPIYEPASTDPLVQAVERASSAGIVVVASAGNNGQREDTGAPGYAGLTSPGNAPSAITVGASSTNSSDTRDDDRVTPFSSRGPTWVLTRSRSRMWSHLDCP